MSRQAETQIGGFIPSRDAEHIDFIAVETETSRIEVVRAMIRACLSDPDRFVQEWMPPNPKLVQRMKDRQAVDEFLTQWIAEHREKAS